MTETERQSDGGSPLQAERGSTRINDAVVSRIAGIAAGEVEGVHMGGGASRAVGGLLQGVAGGSSGDQTRGVSVDVGRTEAAIDLKMGIEYGMNILERVERVREKIFERVQSFTGLRVTELNVTVSSIVFSDGEGDGREGGREQPRGRSSEGGGPLAEDPTTEIRPGEGAGRRGG